MEPLQAGKFTKTEALQSNSFTNAEALQSNNFTYVSIDTLRNAFPKVQGQSEQSVNVNEKVSQPQRKAERSKP
jgi:hypothetical protein